MATIPYTAGRPQVDISFSGISGTWGHLFEKFEFKGMVNGGYIVRCKLIDPSYQLLKKLIEQGYFKESRSKSLDIKFQIKAGVGVSGPERATSEQTAKIISMEPSGDKADAGEIEFVAIDNPSWYLNTGDGSGEAYRGKISDVIKKVVAKYAPTIQLDIGETTDSRENRWWMMRQDPRTFISSLLDWSSAVTKEKTQWIIAMAGDDLIIKEQAALLSKQRAFYRFYDGQSVNNLVGWSAVANNALSIVQTKIITQGVSAVSGRYFDKITDKDENIVFAKDSTTSKKIIANVPKERSFAKPNDDPGSGPPNIGWTAVPATPEIYNGGELGLRYDEYIDGRARSMYLNMMNSLLRVKFRVFGHGEWSDCRGLGVDTIYVKWTSEPTYDAAGKKTSSGIYWLTGNWLVYGFHHIVTRGAWWTDLYVARSDYNAMAKKAGGNVQPVIADII